MAPPIASKDERKRKGRLSDGCISALGRLRCEDRGTLLLCV